MKAISESIRAFNVLADDQDTISQADMDYFVSQQAVPSSLQDEYEADPLYGVKSVLFRRVSNNARLTIFDGGHEMIYGAALAWVSQQEKDGSWKPLREVKHGQGRQP